MTLSRQDNTPSKFLLGGNKFQSDTFTAAGANTYPQGMLMGRLTADGKLHDWDPGAADGTEVVVAVLAEELVTAGAGDVSVRVLISGPVRADQLKDWNGGTPLALTKAQYDLLRDTSIIPEEDIELLKFDN